MAFKRVTNLSDARFPFPNGRSLLPGASAVVEAYQVNDELLQAWIKAGKLEVVEVPHAAMSEERSEEVLIPASSLHFEVSDPPKVIGYLKPGEPLSDED